MIQLSKNKRWPSRNSTRLKFMWDNNHLCAWCNRETILVLEEIHPNNQLPPFAATTEHIYPRNHPTRKRYKKRRTPSPITLACFECNQKRGDMPYQAFEKIANMMIDFDEIVYC